MLSLKLKVTSFSSDQQSTCSKIPVYYHIRQEHSKVSHLGKKKQKTNFLYLNCYKSDETDDALVLHQLIH